MCSVPHRHNRAAATADSPSPRWTQRESRAHFPLPRCIAPPDVRAADPGLPHRTMTDGETRKPHGGAAEAARETRESVWHLSSNWEATETGVARAAHSARPRPLGDTTANRLRP